MYYRNIYLILILLSVLNLVSCTSINGWVGSSLGFDTDLTLSFEVSKHINLDDKKNPSPLFIRLYELKSAKIFDLIDFISLYERDEEVLGDDFITKQELKRLIPGENRVDKLVLNKDTKIIALFAEFFDYKDSKFKIVTKIVANNVTATNLTVKISNNKIILISGIDENTAK